MILIVYHLNYKKYFTPSNIITALLLGAVLITQGPTWFSNFNMNSKTIQAMSLSIINTDEDMLLDDEKNYILFFWATWCAPCKVDMDRYKNSVLAGKIPKEKFLAINPFEPLSVVAKFIKKNPYPFTFVDDQGVLSRILEVKATPTVTFVEKGKVVRQSGGISLIGIFRAEWFID